MSSGINELLERLRSYICFTAHPIKRVKEGTWRAKRAGAEALKRE